MAQKDKNNSSRFKVWLDQAHHDLEAANVLFAAGKYEWVCYTALQAVEKAFKAIVVHSGYRPPRTHKLGVLLGMGNKANKNLLKMDFDFRKLESYTFISRYPFVVPGEERTPHEYVQKDDAVTCLKLANKIITQTEQFIYSEKAIFLDKEIETAEFYFNKDDVENRIEEVKNEILKCEKLDVKKIILYGSFAREQTRPKSTTMDILIVAETNLSFIERIQYVRQITKGSEPIIEPLIYTPDEFKFMLEEEGEGYLESAIDEGKILFEL